MKKFYVDIPDSEAVLSRNIQEGMISVEQFDTKKEAVNFIRQYIDANVDDEGRICLISEYVE